MARRAWRDGCRLRSAAMSSSSGTVQLASRSSRRPAAAHRTGDGEKSRTNVFFDLEQHHRQHGRRDTHNGEQRDGQDANHRQRQSSPTCSPTACSRRRLRPTERSNGAWPRARRAGHGGSRSSTVALTTGAGVTPLSSCRVMGPLWLHRARALRQQRVYTACGHRGTLLARRRGQAGALVSALAAARSMPVEMRSSTALSVGGV